MATSKEVAAKCRRDFGLPYGPNLADLGGTSSRLIAGEVYSLLGVATDRTTDLDIGELEDTDDAVDGDIGRSEAAGAALERGLEIDLRNELVRRQPDRGWYVTRQDRAHEFSQFAHMKKLQLILTDEASRRIFEQVPDLLNSISRDYSVKSDVMIGLPDPGPTRYEAYILHAAVSAKLTLRSDRAQNVRTEFGVLVRNRRGRLPHLVVVTAEPLPSRLESLTRGTGEIDAVYHLLYDEMDEAITGLLEADLRPPTRKALVDQAARWQEMAGSGRMRPYSALAGTLANT